eukprot:gene2318-13215_t
MTVQSSLTDDQLLLCDPVLLISGDYKYLPDATVRRKPSTSEQIVELTNNIGTTDYLQDPNHFNCNTLPKQINELNNM